MQRTDTDSFGPTAVQILLQHNPCARLVVAALSLSANSKVQPSARKGQQQHSKKVPPSSASSAPSSSTSSQLLLLPLPPLVQCIHTLAYAKPFTGTVKLMMRRPPYSSGKMCTLPPPPPPSPGLGVQKDGVIADPACIAAQRLLVCEPLRQNITEFRFDVTNRFLYPPLEAPPELHHANGPTWAHETLLEWEEDKDEEPKAAEQEQQNEAKKNKNPNRLRTFNLEDIRDCVVAPWGGGSIVLLVAFDGLLEMNLETCEITRESEILDGERERWHDNNNNNLDEDDEGGVPDRRLMNVKQVVIMEKSSGKPSSVTRNRQETEQEEKDPSWQIIVATDSDLFAGTYSKNELTVNIRDNLRVASAMKHCRFQEMSLCQITETQFILVGPGHVQIFNARTRKPEKELSCFKWKRPKGVCRLGRGPVPGEVTGSAVQQPTEQKKKNDSASGDSSNKSSKVVPPHPASYASTCDDRDLIVVVDDAPRCFFVVNWRTDTIVLISEPPKNYQLHPEKVRLECPRADPDVLTSKNPFVAPSSCVRLENGNGPSPLVAIADSGAVTVLE